MKKMFQIGAIFFSLLMTTTIYADQGQEQRQGQYRDQNTAQAQGENLSSCPADHPCEDQRCNDCWCLYCHYEPCYYCTQRCVEEQVPCKKRCCRNVPKYYEVERCRYVPQYYTETICRQEPEYYDVCETKCCKKWVSDKHCKYVPRYYWKHTCGDNSCTTPQPQ